MFAFLKPSLLQAGGSSGFVIVVAWVWAALLTSDWSSWLRWVNPVCWADTAVCDEMDARGTTPVFVMGGTAITAIILFALTFIPQVSMVLRVIPLPNPFSMILILGASAVGMAIGLALSYYAVAGHDADDGSVTYRPGGAWLTSNPTTLAGVVGAVAGSVPLAMWGARALYLWRTNGTDTAKTKDEREALEITRRLDNLDSALDALDQQNSAAKSSALDLAESSLPSDTPVSL